MTLLAAPTLPLPTPASLNPSEMGDDGRLASGWALLHEAGDALAGIARLGRDPFPLPPRDFAMRVAAAGPARLAMVEQGLDDCATALQVGLRALMAARDAGRDCTAAALTLWREWDRARTGLLALVAPRR